ncbi:hypothetical protein SAMN04487980_102521 [Streptomyces sp. cf124]|nr:hypothetical protein SAMN04487980_102521 [Streptomyces sp. cf124]
MVPTTRGAVDEHGLARGDAEDLDRGVRGLPGGGEAAGDLPGQRHGLGHDLVGGGDHVLGVGELGAVAQHLVTRGEAGDALAHRCHHAGEVPARDVREGHGEARRVPSPAHRAVGGLGTRGLHPHSYLTRPRLGSRDLHLLQNLGTPERVEGGSLHGQHPFAATVLRSAGPRGGCARNVKSQVCLRSSGDQEVAGTAVASRPVLGVSAWLRPTRRPGLRRAGPSGGRRTWGHRSAVTARWCWTTAPAWPDSGGTAPG